VIARGDGGTSGSLVLALSMGLPPVVADRPAYRALLGDGETGWVFAPGDRRSLARALAAAAGDKEEARARGRAARVVADGLAWPDIAAQAVPLLTASAR
jgi:phosphatidylinositol alpha-mannosyltransferase